MLDRLRFEREVALLAGPPSAAVRPVAAIPKAAPPAGSETCVEKLKGTRVAVVGGGLAGLMTALQLGEKGVKVTLFEARPKVGGRVSSNTKLAAGRIVEEGAELIGSFHTSWLNLARHYGLTVISRMEAEHYDYQGLRLKLKLDGIILSNAEYFKLAGEMHDVLGRIADKAAQLNFDPSQPWLSSSVAGLDQESVAYALRTTYQVTPRSCLWKMLEWLLVNDEVSQLDRMNHLGLLCKVKAGQSGRLGHRTCPADRRDCRDEPQCVAPTCEALRKCVNEHKCLDETTCRMGYWEELEIFRCADGCEALAREMSSDFQKRLHGTVRTGTEVTDIHIADAGVLIGTKKADPKGKVAPGLPTFSFYDYVVLTAPPTVWDRVQVKAGAIDKDKTKPIGGTPLGLATDPTLVMNSDPAIKFFSVTTDRFWMKESPPAAPSGGSPALGQVWEGTDNQTRTGPGQDTVLSVFAGPIISDSTKPGGFRAPTEAECLAELKTLYKTFPAKLKGKLLMNWPIEPFIRIGYANPGLGQVTGVGKKLTEVYHRRLLFAGEHTSMAFFGYMEGALRSGERAAASIVGLVCPVSGEAHVA